jgi:signal transduction histidine kinase
MKHGKPRQVVIGLFAENGQGTLSVQDDGLGISKILANHAGMGLNIMSYRANMIGGSLDVGTNAAGGTTVVCLFPVGALVRDKR